MQRGGAKVGGRWSGCVAAAGPSALSEAGAGRGGFESAPKRAAGADNGEERRFFMGRCHYCINCGLCRGEKPKAILVPVCIRCGHKNSLGSETCEACGESLRLQPGVTNTANRSGFSTR